MNRMTKIDSLGVHVPTYLLLGILAHVVEGRKVGGFLTSLLSNDLVGAVGRADPVSFAALRELSKVLVNGIPRRSWGTQDRVEEWRELGGWAGTTSAKVGGCPDELRGLLDAVPEWDGWRP